MIYRWLIVPHLLCVAWAIYVEATPGLVCPLTPLENYFAIRAGRAGYEGSFVEHYLVPILYPDGLTRTVQLAWLASSWESTWPSTRGRQYAGWLASGTGRARIPALPERSRTGVPSVDWLTTANHWRM